MKMDYSTKNHKNFFQIETNRALEWLYDIQEGSSDASEAEGKCGWAWVQFIRPNEQNTAEVIATFVDYVDWLKEKEISENMKINPVCRILEPIKYWLIDTSHAQISIDYSWVMIALQKVRECDFLMNYETSPEYDIDADELQESINKCADWICNHYKETDDSKEIGWGDNDVELPSSIRTSLALIALNREIEYLKCINNQDILSRLNMYCECVNKGMEWLFSSQMSDGGWGNLRGTDVDREYQTNHSFSYDDLKYQTDSNPASTGYAICALMSDKNKCKTGKYEGRIRKAIDYLKKSQLETGGWPVFTEVGIRDGVRYTFRHFSTTWALSGMLKSGLADYSDDYIIHGFSYLISLQDENYGGWKSFPDADCYTWSTCNALSTILLLRNELSEVRNKQFLNIIWDWWSLKIKSTDHNFEFKKVCFAFNNQMALLFCIVFSIMITAVLLLIISIIDPSLEQISDVRRKLIYSVMIVISGTILGLPWIVYVKNRFYEKSISWLDSIGWVYGIITGFVLVLYQFVL